MSSLVRHMRAMAFNNAWANHRLLAACAPLSDAEFAAPRVSFFPSLRHTLNHNLTVDGYYVDMIERSLRGAPPNPAPGRYFDPAQPFASCAELALAQRAVDRRLIDLCSGLTEAQLDGPVQMPRRAGLRIDRVDRILAHLFQHQIHHRGQAHAMLAGTAVAPPQLDEFFCQEDAPLRADDFAALGFSETQIWGDPPAQ
ncbi:MAG: DinB family protein [Burkholderiaceae bacterium]|nr:DinB family protein [Burkholderiaceae bacterium]